MLCFENETINQTQIKLFLNTGLEENLPNLDTLILTNNSIQELADLEPLTSIKVPIVKVVNAF